MRLAPSGASSLSPSPARIRSTIASVVDQPDELREIRLFHKALADVNRLRIVRRLSACAATVTELIDHVGLSQPLVSWHLGKLRASGIVATRRNGRETICSLRPEAFIEMTAREQVLLGLGELRPGAIGLGESAAPFEPSASFDPAAAEPSTPIEPSVLVKVAR